MIKWFITIYLVRYDWKRHSVCSRICWKPLRATIPKQKDEICLNVMDEKFVDWEISREGVNSATLND